MVAFILLSRHWASAGGVQEQPNIFAYLLIFTTRADFSEVYNSFSENSRKIPDSNVILKSLNLSIGQMLELAIARNENSIKRSVMTEVSLINLIFPTSVFININRIYPVISLSYMLFLKLSNPRILIINTALLHLSLISSCCFL